MSTLEYLDEEGTVTNFTLVPWIKLHNWLSELNGSPHYTEIPTGVNRGKVLEELEARRKGKDSTFGGVMKIVGKDRGYGRDWRDYENKEGLTHLEELLVYQPKGERGIVNVLFLCYLHFILMIRFYPLHYRVEGPG